MYKRITICALTDAEALRLYMVFSKLNKKKANSSSLHMFIYIFKRPNVEFYLIYDKCIKACN